jgi:cytochrome c peroxidase
MNKNYFFPLLILVLIISAHSYRKDPEQNLYEKEYYDRLRDLRQGLSNLRGFISGSDLNPSKIEALREPIKAIRYQLKAADFFLRYLEPVSYKKINGPLPVEWEVEVFEKFEKPYRREGAGLTLALLYLDEENADKDSLLHLVENALIGTETYAADSITSMIKNADHFYFANRLFLLNLSTIYTTGFECPDPAQVVPELRSMMESVARIYFAFNTAYPAQAISKEYLLLYKKAMDFIKDQSPDFEQFDHYTFIREYVNPLYSINQQSIRRLNLRSISFVDYTLNNNAYSIFSKNLYHGQNTKGIYLRVYDTTALREIDQLGKMLFYDPILSANNKRSCGSCHKPDHYFTDTVAVTSFQFDSKLALERNSPSLLNVQYNHLIMADGKHLGLQEQAKAVVTNPIEMGSTEQEMLKKVLSCPDYKKRLKRLLKYTPVESEVTTDHVYSAVTFYYGKFGQYLSPFDDAMNAKTQLSDNEKKGFNIFMGKAQCGTCHFPPLFNGVKPPYVSSEFEVLGVPKDTAYSALSPDMGRSRVFKAPETMRAFRTGNLRNVTRTAPYMHNGVFSNLDQVVDFYDQGGGAGKKLDVPNQTLSSEKLNLTPQEKKDLKAFLFTLNERIPQETIPAVLAKSKNRALNTRRPGGEY